MSLKDKLKKIKEAFEEPKHEPYKSVYGHDDAVVYQGKESAPAKPEREKDKVFFDYEMISDYHDDRWDRDDDCQCHDY